MLDYIYNIVTNILDMLGSFFSWVGGLIQDLIDLALLVGRAVRSVPALLGWLPTSIVTALGVGFTIVAAYKILGREG